MKSLPDSFQLEKFGISTRDVTHMVFQCEPEAIHADVILMPWWQPQVFEPWVERIVTLSPNVLFEIEVQGRPVSIVRTGIGAPLAGDATLALGCTGCRRLLFAGSLGGLGAGMRLADLVIPTVSLAGDGFCRYLQAGFPQEDSFLEPVSPDSALSQAVANAARALIEGREMSLHSGPVYSTDSILAQFSWLEPMVAKLGCIGIEMETAAVFKAARRVGIRAAALLSVSDLPFNKQTLYAGRSQAEKEHVRNTRKEILAKAILDCLKDPAEGN